MTTTQNITATIHLQGIGNAPAIQASDLRAGDRIMWNYGYTYTVVSITDVSAKFIGITERATDGREYARKLRKDRLVAKVAAK